MTDRKTTRSQHLLLILATLSASVIVAGCGSNNSAVGSGVKPSYMVLFPSSDRSQTSETEIFECEEAPFKAYLYFTDGSVGDFTDRAVWSSASPGIAQVSNADLPVPYSTFYYSSGVVLPAAGGSTIITADYQGIKGTIRVDVSTPAQLTLTDQYYNPIPDTVNYDATTSAWRLGAGTTVPIKVTALLDGVRKDLTSFAYWSFDNGGDPGVLLVNTYGVLNAVAQGNTQTLRAVFPSCDTQLTQAVTVKNISSLILEPESDVAKGFVDGSGNLLPLIVGNSEKLTVMADFGDSGPQQDVSQFVTFTSTAPDSLGFGAGTTSGNIVTATAPTVPVTLKATAVFANQTELTSNSLEIGAVNGTLESFTVSPPVSSVTAGSIDYVQFNALGLFGLADGSTITQDVTRLVVWGTDGSSLATATSNGVNAGQVTSSATAAPGSVVTVTATESSATVDTEATATLQLN